MNTSLELPSRVVRPVMILVVLAFMPFTIALGASKPQPYPGEAAFRDLYQELVETNTTLSAGSCTAAAGSGAHGLNQHIRVQSLLDARRFLHELVTSYTRH